MPRACSTRLLDGGPHPLHLGPADDIPLLKRQTRLTFARCGIVDPLSLDDYRAHGGYQGLERALALAPAAIVEEVVAVRPARPRRRRLPDRHQVAHGRATTPAEQKYIVCNADEGDSGTFADRMIMEGDPFVLIEGMTIAGIAVGATKGYVYIRSEYPHAVAAMKAAIARGAARRHARRAGRGLGHALRHRGAGRRRRLCLRRRDVAARKPRRQARASCAPSRRCRRIKGLFGKPTVDQQRAVAGHRADHPRRGRGVLSRIRHGPVARHHADPACRQRQARRPVRDGVRHHARRAGRRFRRRHR